MKEPVVHQEKIGKLTVKIIQDLDPSNPREEESNLGTIFHTHRRYDLGTQASPEEIQAIIDNPEFITLPVFIYDHSGVVLNTTGFSCPWDSGQVGIIAMKKSVAVKEWGKKRFTKKVEAMAKNWLKGEVERFSDYLSGNVFGFVVEEEQSCETCGNHKAKHVDSCWGFVGDYEYCLEEARAVAQSHAE